MDATTRSLLIALARTVLRELDPTERKPLGELLPPGVHPDAPPRPPATPPAPEATLAALQPKRGDTVRVWSGDKYVVGVVDSISRTKAGKATVRISRGEGRRDKLVETHLDTMVLLSKGSNS